MKYYICFHTCKMFNSYNHPQYLIYVPLNGQNIRAEKKTPLCGPMSQHRATYEQSHSGPHAFTKLCIFTSNDKILKSI